MLKLPTRFALCIPLIAVSGCSDDDGANVPRKGTMAAGGGSAGVGGEGGASSAGRSGAGGMAGSSGAAGGGTGGGSGSPGCVPVQPDAGVLDAGDAGDPDASGDGGGPEVVSFAADIQPIFAQRCGPCHTTDGYAGHNVGGADLEAAYADAVRLGQDLVGRINGGGMPPSDAPPPNDCADGAGPGDPGCVTVEELNRVQTWLAQCSPR